MIIHYFEQGTPERYAVRKGKMTASKAQAIGNQGKGLTTYINEKMASYYSSSDGENFANADTRRGNELEDTARDMYELQTGNKVEQVGFIEHSEYCGCSPDGLIGEDGGIEIKCQSDPVHFELLIHGRYAIDSKYIRQMQMCMWITGRKWRHFVSYNPNYVKSLIIHRIEYDEEIAEKIQVGVGMGIGMITNIKKQFEEASKPLDTNTTK